MSYLDFKNPWPLRALVIAISFVIPGALIMDYYAGPPITIVYLLIVAVVYTIIDSEMGKRGMKA